ncbi:hypothetical protein CA13_73620 [Planctomycetes bacterium CA13]|uniref:Uncharacterized protein n=1 Tax=Novipirellula herctigrandis TaxID=2527986 RepID=A0A5C5YLV0_9BACT|nr:hypothetical protein CA13_73620 [Planctomycetes bacterium CA13]
MTQLYILDDRLLFGSDYGRALVRGCAPRNDDDGLLHILRTGPFVPPVYIGGPGDNLLVSDSFRAILESSALAPFTFRETVYDKTVDVPWHTWDLNADEPESYPASYEPDGYIFDLPHDDAIEASMERIWEVVLDRPPCNVISGDHIADVTAELKTGYGYPQLFYGSQYAPRFPLPIVGPEGMDWFVRHAGEWIGFRKLKLEYKKEVVYPSGPSR